MKALLAPLSVMGGRLRGTSGLLALSLLALAVACGIEVYLWTRPPNLVQALRASVADQSNDEKMFRLRDTIMQSTVYFNVPNSMTEEFKANNYQFKDGQWHFASVVYPGTKYNCILVFTSISEAKKMPTPSRYFIGVTGRQLFEFAHADGFCVVLNAYSKPSISWPPELVADYLK
jgi:hypothetical protein